MRLRRLCSVVGTTGLLAIAFLVLPAAPASACSCVGPMSSDDHIKQAEVAFLGDVIAARIADPDSVIQGEARLGSPEMIYTFDVREIHKGAVAGRVDVRSSLDGASCGAGLRINHRYVVYAQRTAASGGSLQTGLCDGTYEPDGVNSFPLAGGELVRQEPPGAGTGGWYGAPAGEPIPRPGVSPAAFGGLMLLSAAIAGALVAVAGRN